MSHITDTSTDGTSSADDAASAAPQHEVTSATQEVRIASAMTGGVSLAIWMGGVARELNLLDQASRMRESRQRGQRAVHEESEVIGIYRRLLDRLDQVIRIDVLSGTSAGGINAAILGFCHARGVDLGILRGIWLRAGSFETLLRDPTDAVVPSLLQGDEVLLKELREGFYKLGDQVPTLWGAGERDTEVFITTALLQGEKSRFTDSYGTLVKDVNHLGICHFNKDDLTSRDAIPAIALAGRSTASFPAAFEPAYLPFASRANGSNSDTHPGMGDYVSITKPHWVADGGLLANRPIAPLLEAIFEQPARDREVRRTLLYVVPDPGGNDQEAAPATMSDPLTMGEALMADLSAMLNQSIADDLNAISEHNDRVDAMRDTRMRIAELAALHTGATDDDFLSAHARGDYARRQGEWVVRPIVSELLGQLSAGQAEGHLAWATALAAGSTTSEDCRRAARAAIADSWDTKPASFAELARFGRPAYDAAKAMAISVVRAAYPLAAGDDDRAALAALGTRLHAAFPASSSSTPARAVQAAMDADPGGDLVGISVSAAQAWLAERAVPGAPPPGTTAATGSDLAESWQLLAQVLLDVRDLVAQFPQPTADPDDTAATTTRRASATERQTRSRARLNTFSHYLFDAQRDPVDLDVALRLLDLHVAERSMLPVDIDVEQPVQLIQVSANTRTLLDPQRSSAGSKLTGVQFHHFGAFYKGSWRANDWMWGRLDGAGWVVHMLLDPQRIAAIHEGDSQPDQAERFLSDLESIAPLDPNLESPVATREMALKELRFLDDVNEPIPVSLPATAMRVAAAIQQRIAATELVEVAKQTAATESRREHTWVAPVLRAHNDVNGSPSDVAALLPTCPVPDEKLPDEVGEPLFTKTLTKTLAVTTAASTSLRQPPASLKPVFSAARATTVTMYRAGQTSGWGQLKFGGIGLLLAVVGGFLMVHQRTLVGLTGTIALFAGLTMVAISVYGWSRRLLSAVIGVVVTVGIVMLCLPWFRETVHGEGGDDRGWLSSTLEPWMRDNWWSSLVILAIMALLVLIGRLTARPKRTPTPTAP